MYRLDVPKELSEGHQSYFLFKITAEKFEKKNFD